MTESHLHFVSVTGRHVMMLLQTFSKHLQIFVYTFQLGYIQLNSVVVIRLIT